MSDEIKVSPALKPPDLRSPPAVSTCVKPDLNEIERRQILATPSGGARAPATQGPLRIVSDKSVGSRRHIIAEIHYPGETHERSEFVGPVGERSSGPVLMILSEHVTPVYDPSRFGLFGTEWVLRFYGEI